MGNYLWLINKEYYTVNKIKYLFILGMIKVFYFHSYLNSKCLVAHLMQNLKLVLHIWILEDSISKFHNHMVLDLVAMVKETLEYG